MNDLNKADELKEKLSQETEQTPPPPPPPIDAVIHAAVTDNRLQAYINIDPPKNGGAAPTLEALRESLENLKVVYGINDSKLLEISKNPVYKRNIIVAKGTESVNGKDGTYEFLFKIDKEHRPAEKNDGTVDYYDLGIIENVRKGQLLCKITNPTDGVDGTTVFGARIPSFKGRAVPSFLGKNTEMNEAGTEITSKIDGYVDFSGRKINVNDTFYVKENVDNSTGNIKVLGNITVSGTVLPGFTVEATGKIEIRGNVESATLKGRDIILHSGVTGSKIYCEGDLKGRFIENCNVFAKGSVKAEYIMNSNIKCGKDLQIVGTFAKFLGGSCVVGGDMTARTIGSENGIKTDIELGTDSTIIARQQTITKEIPTLEKQVKSLEPLISLLLQLKDANRLTPEKKEMLNKANASYEDCKTLIESDKKELDEIKESLEAKGFGKIVCAGTIFPGTAVKIGDIKMTVDEPLYNSSLYNSEGEIKKGTAR